MTVATRRHVLLVADDERVRELLDGQLRAEGFVVRHTGGRGAVETVRARRPDVVVLHLERVRPDGLDVLRAVRTAGDPFLASVRVITVSARDSEDDRIVALDLGADDHVVELVGAGELAARVRALLRRGELDPEPTRIELGELHIDLDRRRVAVHGRPVELTTREFDLLAFLARNQGRTYTRPQLHALVRRPPAEGPGGSSVAEHIRGLRRKLEPDPTRPRWLRTVRRVGYQIAPAARPSPPFPAGGGGSR